MSRTESSSSINSYKQCPRKYFYAYKLKLPTRESLAAIAGNIIHNSLETFYNINLEKINHKKFEIEFEHFLTNTFHNNWVQVVPKMIKLKFDKDKILEYYEDSKEMLANFLRKFCDNMRRELSKADFKQAFQNLKPQTEVHILSEKYNVQGYIDAMFIKDDEITIVDYKTSKKDELTEQYQLQLAIYALLTHEKFGKLPKKVYLYFLRHGTEIPVAIDESLLKTAQKEVEEIHKNTVSNLIDDYPKVPNNMCCWCDFQDECYGQQKLNCYNIKPPE
jgi:putative RecB family exonuclease